MSDEVLTPQYNPLDEDVKLTDASRDLSTERERKELRARSLTHRRSQGLALSKVAVGIRSEEPMPYDLRTSPSATGTIPPPKRLPISSIAVTSTGTQPAL